MNSLKAAICLLIVLFTFKSFASTVVINSDFSSHIVTNLTYSFEPSSIETALQLEPNKWHSVNTKLLNFGLESRPVWVTFEINNTLNNRFSPLILIDNPFLNEVQLFHLRNAQILSEMRLGDSFSLDERTIKSEFLLTKLTLPASSSTRVILKVSNPSGLRIPISLWQQDVYLTQKEGFNLVYGLMVGFLAALALSCIFLYGFTRKRYFALAGAITFTLGLFLAYLGGFGFRYLHPNIPTIQQVIMPILLILIALLFFPLQQQMCKPHAQKIIRVQKLITKLLAVSLLFIWLLPNWLVTAYCLILTPLVLSLYFLTTYLSTRSHPSKSINALLLALGFFNAVTVYFIITVMGWYTFETMGLVIISVLFFSCTFCLCYAVMKQFITERDEQIIEQQTVIAESTAQDTLLKERLALQEEAQYELESQVDERTFELQVTLRELEEKNRELEQLNTEDALTGAKNRRFFDKKLVMELRRSRREQTPLSIIMIDIDHFKTINDTYGHLSGDNVIKATADIIKRFLKRPLDEVARYGGEEFVILLPNTANQGAFDIAEQIRLHIYQNPVIVAGAEIKFTISAGVYTFIADDINTPELFTECADKALYSAKQQGRNQVVNFETIQ